MAEPRRSCERDRSRVALVVAPTPCYPGGMRRKVTTEKVSVSLPSDQLAALRAHAKRKYDGNLSAAIAGLARIARYEDGADALVAALGPAARVTAAEAAALEAEWTAPLPPAPLVTARRRSKAA